MCRVLYTQRYSRMTTAPGGRVVTVRLYRLPLYVWVSVLPKVIRVSEFHHLVPGSTRPFLDLVWLPSVGVYAQAGRSSGVDTRRSWVGPSSVTENPTPRALRRSLLSFATKSEVLKFSKFKLGVLCTPSFPRDTRLSLTTKCEILKFS